MGLYSLDPDKFEDADQQLSDRQRRIEMWDETPTFLEAIMDRTSARVFETDIDKANRRIADLEAEILLLKGAIDYLEGSKVVWLESEIRRLRDGR